MQRLAIKTVVVPAVAPLFALGGDGSDVAAFAR